MRYQVVFVSGSYRSVDFETDNYEQAEEVKRELTNDMRLGGEKNFFYVIEDTKHGKSDDDLLDDSDFQSLCGR